MDHSLLRLCLSLCLSSRDKSSYLCERYLPSFPLGECLSGLLGDLERSLREPGCSFLLKSFLSSLSCLCGDRFLLLCSSFRTGGLLLVSAMCLGGVGSPDEVSSGAFLLSFLPFFFFSFLSFFSYRRSLLSALSGPALDTNFLAHCWISSAYVMQAFQYAATICYPLLFLLLDHESHRVFLLFSSGCCRLSLGQVCIQQSMHTCLGSPWCILSFCMKSYHHTFILFESCCRIHPGKESCRMHSLTYSDTIRCYFWK